MKQFEGTLEAYAHQVAFRWWGGDTEGKEDLLKQEAEDRIRECIAENCTSGQLCHEDEKGNSLTGWWEIQKG
jgi:hypothetical protein